MTNPGRRRVLAAGAAAMAGLAGCGQVPGQGGTPEQGDITLETLDVGGSPGDAIAVQPTGTVTLLDFFATWCEPCKPQMAELREVHAALPDVHMLSITWENEPAAIREFWQAYEGTWPVAMDTELKTGQRYGVNTLPTMVIVDADGEEVWRHSGLAQAATIQSELEAAQ